MNTQRVFEKAIGKRIDPKLNNLHKFTHHHGVFVYHSSIGTIFHYQGYLLLWGLLMWEDNSSYSYSSYLYLHPLSLQGLSACNKTEITQSISIEWIKHHACLFEKLVIQKRNCKPCYNNNNNNKFICLTLCDKMKIRLQSVC